MNIRRSILAFSAALAFGGLARSAEEQKRPTGEVARALLAWIDSVGLKDNFIFESEATDRGSFSVSLYAGNIENVLGREQAESLYTRIFLKLVTFTSRPSTFANLHIVIRDGGYCDAAIVQKTAQLDPLGVIFKTKLVRPRIDILCSLNFEAIRRYEERTATAASDARRAVMDPTTSSSPTQLTTDSIRAALTQKYEKRDAKVTVTEQTTNWLSLVVRGLQREVISTQRFWERLQIFVFVEQLAGASRMRMILDGKYGPGLAPPSEFDYKDMEPIYTSLLNEYGKALALSLSGAK